MKTRFPNQFPSATDEWLAPWQSVDPDPSGETGGGGAAPTTAPAPIPPTPSTSAPVGGDDGDEAALGDAGKRALTRIRAEKDETTKKLAEALAQIEDMKKHIPPEKYAELIQRYEDMKRDANKRELELQQQKNETEAQFQTRLVEAERQRDDERKAREQAEANAEAERNRRLEFAKRTILSNAFYANGGKNEQDDGGTTFFDLFMAARGDKMTRYDPETNTTYVVDGEGKIVNGDDGEPLALNAWLNQLAETNPIIGALFAPRSGSGSGGIQGAKGVRTQQVADVDEQRRKRPERLLSEAFNL